MAAQPDTDPLSRPERMLSLLSLHTSPAWSADDLGAILSHQLDAPLGSIASLHEHASRFPTLRQLLLDDSPPMDALDRLKHFAKSATHSDDLGLPREVATVIYVAAIVAARRAGGSLSKLDDAAL